LGTFLTSNRKEDDDDDDDSSSTRNLADPDFPLPIECYGGRQPGVHTIISSNTEDYKDAGISAHQDISRIRVQQDTVVEVDSA
jgi:hypothetical protein